MHGLITASALVFSALVLTVTARIANNSISYSIVISNNNNTTTTSSKTNTSRTSTSVTLQTTFTTHTQFDNILSISIEHQDFRRQNVRRNRKRKSRRSTSSSSGVKDASNQPALSGKKESLEMTDDSSIEYSNKKAPSAKKTKKIKIATTSEEYQDGWRKWHRKCYRCPEMEIKYRDPTIKWICGAYQRARRSFKSLCMMHYRNCQDGTMFVKISDHRCPNQTGKLDLPHGEHFFYDYKAALDSESTKTDDVRSASDTGSSVSNTFSITEDEEERKRNAMKLFL